MEEKRKEIIVGFTVIVGVIVLVAGILWGKGGSMFSKKVVYRAAFISAEGLKPGDNVIVRGVRCGRVKSVELTPGEVNVDFRVRKNIKLFSDMNVSIVGLEMMGGKALIVNPGESGKPADPDIIYNGVAVPGIDKIFTHVANVVEGADSLLLKVSSLIDRGKMKDSAISLNKAVNSLNLMISENRKSLKSAIDRLNELSSVLKQDSSAQHFALLISRADSTMKLLQDAVHIATKGSGTLGKMIQDSTLYIQIVKTSRELDSLVADLKEHPAKYVHVSIF
ncbi:MCE family protein [bacterium]|nr:MCE family protein [bacterium]